MRGFVRAERADSVAAELAAFANSGGGQLFVGVNDDGTIAGLSAADVRRPGEKARRGDAALWRQLPPFRYEVPALDGVWSVLATLARLGCGADTVSEGEIRRALAAGVPAMRQPGRGRRSGAI